MSGDKSKLPGKTEWAGRRRPMTRRAGYTAQAPVELEFDQLDGYELQRGESLVYQFSVPASDTWVGFGGWFSCPDSVDVALDFDAARAVLTIAAAPDWSKVGSLWLSDGEQARARLTFSARRRSVVTTYSMLAGEVEHDYLRDARPELLGNMWAFAPEANFYAPSNPGEVLVGDERLRPVAAASTIALKSCNRCGRFLPVNVRSERIHLSFSNHCVAAHRRPCQHSGFGRIPERDSENVHHFDYGFQLECRFCKKFEVNAAHNPQRTAGQMKEDAARRRHFELLLEHLYRGTPQLRYKNLTGHDLAEDVWYRFDGRCFKCGTRFADVRAMHLDHTRPLALLWPLDATATALCATHNSEKRDRPPVDYYTEDELLRLSEITSIPITELQDPSPNLEAVGLLVENLDWFRADFLTLPALQRVYEGKRAAELLVKALQKALDRCPGGAPLRVDNLA